MNYLSICSGVEAASVAWDALGWKPVAFSEIEPFPSAVLAHHWPDIPNLGDMTQYYDWKLTRNIDLLVGGTPCQAFSIAGLREGLKDPRGNLTLTFLGLAEKFRPMWIVWENVAGVLSDKSNAFGQFIAGLSELGYDCAWRVLDAQFFGVAQRRRRVFVVGCAGGQPGSAAKVLFEPESLQGNPAPRRGERKDAASYTASSFGSYEQGCGTLRANGGDLGGASETLLASSGVTVMSSGQANAEITHEISPTLNCNRDGSPIAFGIQGNIIDRAIEHGAENAIFCGTQNDALRDVSEEMAPTLRAGNQGGAVTPMCNQGLSVRRLTPTECERLQGFPDNHTRISWRNKAASDCPDGPRYKAMGNSMAVPVMRWIGKRIQSVEGGEA